MKRVRIVQSIAAPAIAAVAVLMAAPAHAEYRCEAPSTNLDKRVCALAQQAPSDLRHFVERTRMIYGLYFFDYAVSPDRAQIAAAQSSAPPSAVATARPTLLATNVQQ